MAHPALPVPIFARHAPSAASAWRSSIAALRRWTAGRSAAPIPEPEPCTLCAAPLDAIHPHLWDLRHARLVCACRACALLFSDATRQEARGYLPVPDRVVELDDFRLTDAEWNELGIPIGLAFILLRDAATVACYPSPAGATEAFLLPASWMALQDANPLIQDLHPFTEALLIDRLPGRCRYFRAPIDLCYELVGLIRIHWRGLSGGIDLWQKVRAFLDRLPERSGSAVGAGHA